MKHLFAAAVALLSSAVVEAGPFPVVFDPPTEISITDLGTLGGARSEAYDINNRGVVVGWAENSSNVAQAFQYLHGPMLYLDVGIGPHTNVATSINNSDQVVGTFEIGGFSRAFRAQLGLPIATLLVGADPTSVNTSAAAIADSGAIVGQRDPVGEWLVDAVIWQGAALVQPLEPCDRVNDINSAGEAVGFNDKFVRMVVCPRPGSGLGEELVPPRLFCGDSYKADALGINSAGEVVGYEACAGEAPERAFFWDRGSSGTRDLGLLPTGTHSVADDINDDRFIVGYADRETGGFKLSLDTAFLYHADFGMFALPRPKFAVWFGHCRAKALNARNATTGMIQVVGTCDTGEGTRAVRWDVKVTSRLLIPPLPYPPK